jgi:16S rRNA (uracil1498-N3)-methyltransferase
VAKFEKGNFIKAIQQTHPTTLKPLFISKLFMVSTPSKRLPRFLCTDAHSVGQQLSLSEEQLHHAGRVLRLREGQSVLVWNGDGLEFLASLHFSGAKHGFFLLTDLVREMHQAELQRKLMVLQALPEGDKMDWVLEKCTELGAHAFYPVQAQRSVVRLDSTRLAKRQHHWLRVVEAACLQSERGVLPGVATCLPLAEQLKAIRTTHPEAKVLWFTPEAAVRLTDWLPQEATSHMPNQAPLVICVGPEGGWTPQETSLALDEGAQALRFSPRVLRTETFAMACVAQLTGLLRLDQA